MWHLKLLILHKRLYTFNICHLAGIDHSMKIIKHYKFTMNKKMKKKKFQPCYFIYWKCCIVIQSQFSPIIPQIIYSTQAHLWDPLLNDHNDILSPSHCCIISADICAEINTSGCPGPYSRDTAKTNRTWDVSQWKILYAMFPRAVSELMSPHGSNASLLRRFLLIHSNFSVFLESLSLFNALSLWLILVVYGSSDS